MGGENEFIASRCRTSIIPIIDTSGRAVRTVAFVIIAPQVSVALQRLLEGKFPLDPLVLGRFTRNHDLRRITTGFDHLVPAVRKGTGAKSPALRVALAALVRPFIRVNWEIESKTN